MTLIAVVGSCGQTSEPTTTASTADPANADTVIHCGILIDGVADTPRKNQTVAIPAGRFGSGARARQGVSAPGMLGVSEVPCRPGL
ncbi:MAG: hypothetical protein VW806_01985, partial [Halieaceae bacterium]